MALLILSMSKGADSALPVAPNYWVCLLYDYDQVWEKVVKGRRIRIGWSIVFFCKLAIRSSVLI